MFEIGGTLKREREDTGISLEEAASDLGLKESLLSNIEDGSIGCFKDITELKMNIASYAKYLGLDPDKLVDQFNEYMFEYTSKIPLKELEEKVAEQNKEKNLEEVVSPYSKPSRKHTTQYYIILYICIILGIILVIAWSVKEIASIKLGGSYEYSEQVIYK